MYCEDSLGTGIDHFRPKTSYPERAFSWKNYLLACSYCNSNQKRSVFPLDEAGKALLVKPTRDDPADHLVLVPETGLFMGVTVRGEITENVFGLNRKESLSQGRKDQWEMLLKVVRDVGAANARNDRSAMVREISLARRSSFQSVVHHLVKEALRAKSPLVPPDVAQIIPPDVAQIIRDTRKEWSWAL